MDLMPCSSPCVYQITRDNLGSAIQYASKNGVRYRYSYSPWGVRTHQVGGNTVFYQPGDDSPFGPFYRTYTGHEDLWMFGLINANARLYSPYLGRFVSPDPLLNSEGGPLDYNPYIYARNNPYKYIDRNGEFPFLLSFALGLWGTLYSNFDNMNCAGDFFGVFGTYVLSSALSVCVSSGVNVALAGGSFGAGFLGAPASKALTGFWTGAAIGAAGGCAGGMVTGAGNSWLNGSSFANGLLDGLTGGVIGGVSGAISGGLLGGIDAVYKYTNFFTGIGNFDVTGACATSNTGEIIKLEGKIRAQYIGEFEGVNVYETEDLGYFASGNYAAEAQPKYGILAGLGVYENKVVDMLQHEFGHILQYREYGADAYYKIIAPEAQASYHRALKYNKLSLHYNHWTETHANFLSQRYFGAKWQGGAGTNYPAANISLINEIRLRSVKNW